MSRFPRTLATVVLAAASLAGNAGHSAAAVRYQQHHSQQSGPTLELTPFVGYYIASDLFNNASGAISTGAKIGLDNSFMWGFRLTSTPYRSAGIEFAYTRTGSDATLNQLNPGQTTNHVGRVDFDNFDLNFLAFQPSGNPRVTPFVALGFGWAVSHPDIDPAFLLPGSAKPDSHTLFNFNFGLGTKIAMNNPKLAMRLEGRWRVTDTAVTTSTGYWCDPWGYCYSYASDWYNSGELIGGLSYKFR